MKYCSKCGNKMADDMLFCQQCGTKFVEMDEEPIDDLVQDLIEEPIEEMPNVFVSAAEKSESSLSNFAEKVSASAVITTPIVKDKPQQKKQSAKKRKTWILIAVYVVLCIATDGVLPLLVGIVGFPICLLLLIFSALRKKDTKRVALWLAAMFVSIVVGGLLLPSEDCEENGHEYVEEVLLESTCRENGEVKHTCSRCEESYVETLPLVNHTYIEEVIKPATCSEEGEIKKTCSNCDAEVIDVVVAEHDYVEKELVEATCEMSGEKKFACTFCGDEKVEEIAPIGHSWEKATCSNPKTCKVCKTTSGEALGHTTDAGICDTCNERVEKLSPVTIVGMRYTIDFLGGVEWTFRIKNNTDKEIKYITFQWNCYNAVGDPIRDDITGKTYVRIRFTGPLGAGQTTGEKCNTTLFYNNTYDNVKIAEITVEYMDGTKESINEFYYGFAG